MAERSSHCTVCLAEVVSGTRGPVPVLCVSCRRQTRLTAATLWKRRNPGWRATYNDRTREAQRRRNRAYYAANRAKMAVKRRSRYLRNQQATVAKTVRLYRFANPGKHAEIENRRRARKLAAFVEPVDPAAIYERDRGICQICYEPVDRELASLDHIIPLSRNGTHEPGNVQIAHRSCHSRKGSKLVT